LWRWSEKIFARTVAVEDRNRFVIEKSESLWLSHVNSGGMIDRLLGEIDISKKTIVPTRWNALENN